VHPFVPAPRPLRAMTCISELIGPTLYGKRAEPATPSSPWITFLCLVVSIALLLIALGHGAGRRSEVGAPVFFWGGVVLMVLPLAGRIAWPVIARSECLFLLVLFGETLYLYKLLNDPTHFGDFDELLHWVTANDILFRRKLFLDNSLLPISPLYPALEILTTALANLSGLEIFPAYAVVFVVLRAVFIVALFLFVEKITESTRIAALTSLVYFGCPTFIIFDASFAYESLAVVLGILIMLSEIQTSQTQSVRSIVLPMMLIGALAVTHHISALFCAIYMIGLFVLQTFRRNEPDRARALLAVLVVTLMLLAIALPLAMAKNKILGYLGPTIDAGISSFLTSLGGHSAETTREAFVGANGEVQPVAYRIIGMLSLLLIAIGLATGFFRSLCLTATTSASGWGRLLWIVRRRWNDSRAVLLTLGAFGFPLSVALRLTESGWEIGNRLNTFVFISVGLVIAVGVIHFWQSRVPYAIINLALGTILLSGVILSSNTYIRGQYRVGGDPNSIEHMGVETARWTRTWLGAGNRFAADRVNRTLLATYGDQNVISSLGNRVDESRVFLSNTISPDTIYPIKEGKIDYLLTDLRLTTALPVLGEYYEKGDVPHGRPPLPSRLLKFDNDKRAARIFDDGYIVIYDVRRFHE
jgi:hypothetical protein